MEQQDSRSCLVLWRGQQFVVVMSPSTTLKEMGEKLQELTNIKADTLRLLIPMEKGSKLLYPFSDEHSSLTLESTSVLKVPKLVLLHIACIVSYKYAIKFPIFHPEIGTRFPS